MSDVSSTLEATQQALAEFQANTESMEKIAAYARACWAPEKKHENPAMLKKYAVDALVNVAYFVQRICGQLDGLITAELRDVDNLDLALKGLASRASAARKVAGETALVSMQLPRGYDNQGKKQMEIVRDPPVQKMRAPLDFRSLDNVGMILTPGIGPNPAVLNTWSEGGAVVLTGAQIASAPASSSAAAAPPAAAAFAPRPSSTVAAPQMVDPAGLPPPPPPPSMMPDDNDLPPPPPSMDMEPSSSGSSWLPPPPPPPPAF